MVKLSQMPKLKSVKFNQKESIIALIAIVVLLIIGGYYIFFSNAASTSVALEAENNPTSPATQVTDTSASGGKAVQFNSSTVSTSGILFGSNEPDYPPTPTSNILGAVESQLGRQFDIVRYFHSSWTSSFSQELALANKGYVVSTSFKVWNNGNWKTVSDDLRTPGSAKRVEVENMAPAMQSPKPGPFFVTIHHEPEDDVSASTGRSEQDYGDMFCAFSFVFKSVGNTKAKFAPFPIIDSYTSDNSKGAKVFPGDQCIDWNGADLYMFFGKQKVENWRTIAQVAYNKNVNGTQRAATGWYQFATTDFTGKPCTIANNPTCASNGYVKKLDGSTEPKQSKGKKPIVIGEWGGNEYYPCIDTASGCTAHSGDPNKKGEWLRQSVSDYKNEVPQIKA